MLYSVTWMDDRDVTLIEKTICKEACEVCPQFVKIITDLEEIFYMPICVWMSLEKVGLPETGWERPKYIWYSKWIHTLQNYAVKLPKNKVNFKKANSQGADVNLDKWKIDCFDQGTVTSFCQDPDSKYFQLCGPYNPYCN